jgi:ribosomal protein L11 methyltransferase
LPAVPISIISKRSLDSNNPESVGWIRVTLTTYPEYLEDLSGLLEKFAAISISYIPATTEPIFGDESEKNRYWQQTSVSALFDADIDTDILIACIRNQTGTDNILDFKIEPVGDTNWLDKYKSGFSPMIFGDRLCICPSWLPRPEQIEHVIELDPGLAFGTGTHATTGLCLQWLATHDISGKQVIDYGCGSGILALAAARLGASHVEAVDIDPQALIATTANARNNGLEQLITTSLPADFKPPKADILLANILLNPLLRLASDLAQMVVEGGDIVLSGILSTQAEECRKVYSRWFDMDAPEFRDEWAMLSGKRKDSGAR